MWLAIDRETGIELSIEKAKRYGEYLCPCCGDKVDVARGPQRQSFRHRYGTKRIDCDNYRAGIYRGSFGGWRYEIESRQRPALYGSSYISKEQRTWFLEIFLPQFTSQYDLIVADGYSGVIRIPNGSLPKSGTKVKVIPKDSQYQITQFKEGFGRPLSLHLPGLAVNKINVFAYGDSTGRLLDESISLIRGQIYLLVYHKDMLNVTKALEDYLDLGDLNDWHAIIYRIPMNITPGIQHWITKYLSREVRLPNLSLKLISPAKCLTLANGSIVVPNDTEVIVAIDGAKGSKAPGLLGIKSSVNAKSEWVPLKGTLPQVINLGNLESGTYDLLIPGENTAFLQIITQPLQIIKEHFNIQFVFNQLDNIEKKLAIPTFSKQITACFENVKFAKSEVASFFATKGIPFELIIKKTYRWIDQTNQSGDNTLICVTSSIEMVDRLTEALKNNWHISFNAGNFGSFEIFPRSKKEGLTPKLFLTDSLRNKIEWMYQSNVGNNRTRLQPYYVGYVQRTITYQLLSLFDYNDQELLKKLGRIKSIQAELLHNYLDIISQVSRIGKRGVRK